MKIKQESTLWESVKELKVANTGRELFTLKDSENPLRNWKYRARTNSKR